MPNSPKRAVVLVSGGLDSATALAVARRDGFETFALSFDYGQRHSYELEAARRVAQAAHVRRQLFFKLDLRSIGGSSLTADLPVPKDRPESEMTAGIPITYVPARNT
ncbi:MAG TPA: 7-cyano-7-deazaguanine synthase, partial [Planctomycetaceae bacterium]|nr:7-cyano-7-deazaguanine synthase [Planctomycetaceae bacterium]